MKLHLPFARLALVLVYLTALLSVPSQAAAQPASIPAAGPSAGVPAADPAAVGFMRDLLGSGQIAPGDTWLIGGGYLYWAQCKLPGPAIAAQSSQLAAAVPLGYLRRWPIRGGAVATLSSDAFCNTAAWAADDSGLYYWQAGFIYRRSLASALTPVAVTDTGVYGVSGALVLDGGYLFYILGNDDIYRTPKAQVNVPDDPRYDETMFVAEGGAGATSLIVNGSALDFFGGGRVRSVNKTCTETCTVSDLAIEPGVYLSNAAIASPIFGPSTNPLWVTGPLEQNSGQTYAGNQIRGYSCRFTTTGYSCNSGTDYTAPNRIDGTNTARASAIGPMASDGNYLFWVENLKICNNGPFGFACQPSNLGRLMKYHIGRAALGSSDPFDTPQPIATQNSSGIFSIDGTPPVGVADGWVYFDTSNGLSRIRADAPPISWDLAFNGWEITQGVQNLFNDVPLVANKPTYVRVYGSKLSGPSAFNVEALLFGTAANGAALGSLRSINGPQSFATNGGSPNRAATSGGWLFQLPDAWTSTGNTKLTLQIDPRAVWNDPNRANNNVNNQSFTFNHKAPVCIVTIPVRTHGPVADNNSPNLFFARDMLKRLWPVSDVWLFHQDDDIAELQARFGIPPWEYGPYEIPDDTGKMITSLTLRDMFSDDPDQCDNAGARTHYVGIVSPQTQTGDDNPDLGTNGSGRIGYDQAWIKLPADGYQSGDWQAVRAATLAHELAHNYGREHVNCGGPDDPDGGYPYVDGDGQSCTIDNRDQAQASTYFGFNPVNQSPIKPTDARDLMAYGRNRWISDYTFRAIMNNINGVAALSTQAVRAPKLAAANDVVLVTGVISSTEDQGQLNYGWVLPTATLGHSMLGKWQTSAAATATQARTNAAAPNYYLRLLDASGAVLDSRIVTPAQSDLHNDQPTAADQHDVQTFALTFPAPAGQVARMELLADSTLLASLQPGSGAPTVSVLSPAGGETIDNAMTLSWRASDPDPNDKLLFSVQYSPDNGQHWRALLSNFPNQAGSDTVTLNLKDLSGIPASTSGGLIRVAASDGYNTSVAVSQPFTVVNRAPAPHIDSPGDTPLPAGQTIVLQGTATDVEDGGLSGAALRWTLNGADIGSGQAQTIEGLAPGSYTLALTARDSAGKEATATQTLTVAPLAIPKTVAPAFAGDCNDAAYTNAAHVSLAPYDDGTQAFVSLVRTDDALYVCFNGMKRSGVGSPGTLAVVRVDSDYGRRDLPGANDHVFYTNEAGLISTFNGNGTGYVAGSGGAGAQISASSTSWNAELRIDASAVGGMNHMIGIDVEQAWVNSASDHVDWPQRAAVSTPSSWGAASLGDVPQLSDLAPASLPVDAGDTVVTINGSGFANGATVQFNQTTLATTLVSATQLQVTIPAAKLVLAGMFNLTVANPGLADAPSNPLPFSVVNPLPHITQAKLAGNVLILTGSQFAAGATVQLNGNDYPATASGAQISVTVPAADLIGSTDASVSVVNPWPGGGVSNVVTLGAGPVSGSGRVYLPLIARR